MEMEVDGLQEDVVSTTPGNVPVADDEFVVESILGKRFDEEKQIFQYLIKWQGYSEQESTWEPEENLASCRELLVEFEQARDKAYQDGGSKENEAEVQEAPGAAGSNVDVQEFLCPAIDDTTDEEALSKIPTGFDRGFEPDKILGARGCNGELCFLLRWKGTNMSDLVPAKEANVRCPQIVIKFYEERIKWSLRARSMEEMMAEDGEDVDDDEEYDDDEEGEDDEEEDEEEKSDTTDELAGLSDKENRFDLSVPD